MELSLLVNLGRLQRRREAITAQLQVAFTVETFQILETVIGCTAGQPLAAAAAARGHRRGGAGGGCRA